MPLQKGTNHPLPSSPFQAASPSPTPMILIFPFTSNNRHNSPDVTSCSSQIIQWQTDSGDIQTPPCSGGGGSLSRTDHKVQAADKLTATSKSCTTAWGEGAGDEGKSSASTPAWSQDFLNFAVFNAEHNRHMHSQL